MEQIKSPSGTSGWWLGGGVADGRERGRDERASQEAGISLGQPVSAKVEGATVDELLLALLKSTGLKSRRRQKVVEIGPDT